MSEADVEVVRTFHRHYERHDFDAMSELLHPRVVWRGVEPGPACSTDPRSSTGWSI